MEKITFTKKIRQMYPTLSKSKQKIAKYVLDHSGEIALYPAKKIGTLAGTSETTVIRFCHDLGYRGYSELQKEIQAEVLNNSENGNMVTRFKRNTIALSQKENLIEHELNQNIEDLTQISQQLDSETFETFTNAILASKRVIVIGFRKSYPAAYLLTYTLNMLRGNASLYRGEMDENNQLVAGLNKDCVVIAFSFARYVRETILFSENAKENGARVLAFTDDALSPISTYADHLMVVGDKRRTPPQGDLTIFAVINVLLSSISVEDYENVSQNLERYKQASYHLYPFVQNED